MDADLVEAVEGGDEAGGEAAWALVGATVTMLAPWRLAQGARAEGAVVMVEVEAEPQPSHPFGSGGGRARQAQTAPSRWRSGRSCPGPCLDSQRPSGAAGGRLADQGLVGVAEGLEEAG